MTNAPATGSKSFIVSWLLSLLLGTVGADRFYLGKIGTGVLKLVTLGGLGVWSLIDLIMTLVGATRDKAGLALAGYQEHKKVAVIVTLAVLAVSFISGAISGVAGASAGLEGY